MVTLVCVQFVLECCVVTEALEGVAVFENGVIVVQRWAHWVSIDMNDTHKHQKTIFQLLLNPTLLC